MNKNNVIQVFYDGKVVGQLAMRGHSTSFEYDDDWIKTGFPISPFSSCAQIAASIFSSFLTQQSVL